MAEPEPRDAQAIPYPHAEYSILGDDLLLPIPPRITEALRLKPGSILRASITDQGILLEWRPTDNERTWKQRQKRLAKLQEGAGRGGEAARKSEGRQIYYSSEEFLAALEALVHDDADV